MWYWLDQTIMRKLILASLLLFAAYLSIGQTGPGGVGNATGASGQPQNVLWLRANTGVSTTGALVDGWTDQSGNTNSATGTGATRPTFNGIDVNFNGLSSITFPNTAAQNFFLQIPDNDNLDNTNALSIFFIARPSNDQPAASAILSKRSGPAVNQSYFVQLSSGATPLWQTTIGGTGPLSLHTGTTLSGQVDIISETISGTSVIGLRDGTAQVATVGPATIANNTSNLFIGSFDTGVTTNFEGAIGEMIIYRSTLNVTQRQIVENYLSAKYNNPITGDLFIGDNAGSPTFNHDFDLVGIGFSGGTSHLLANSQGFILSPSAGTVDVNGEFVLAAHNGIANVPSVSNLGTGGVVQRWARTWFIDRAAGSVDANLTFDFSEGIAGQFPQNKDNYVLLKLNIATSNYDVVPAITNADKTLVGDQIVFRVADANLVDGVYTLGTLDLTASPVNGLSNRTWYSYQSGNWTTPTSWTLDGGVTPLLVNPSNEIPGISDNVVITSGRTISMNTNNVQINSMEVVGTLNLLASTGHNFITVSGIGRIQTSAATDNLPTASYTLFADASIGGTFEINGTGIALNQARTFKTVEVNLTSTTDIASLEANYTLNGDLRILNGIFRFNNNIAIANRSCTVNGNVTVSSTGGIRTGTAANTRHEFNLNGNFTNDGTAYFTQRSGAVTAAVVNGAEATDGIVDVNLISASRDQSVACNGVTRFYRIEISKGIDETYKATLTASAVANFTLYGKADYNINEANAASNPNSSNLNALGLNFGAVEIGNNVVIPFLNTVTNYAIYEGAQLWVNGGSVTKPTGTAIVPYGRMKVTAGALVASVGSGLTTRENGIIQVDGGTVDVGAIRTSVAGAGAVGSYIQSGGTVTVTGLGGISADYAVFSLTYSGNVFNMSGGTLIVKNRPTDLGTGLLRGTIFINSDPANVNLTGGTVIADITSTVPYILTSRAPFWNLILRNTLDATLRDIEFLGSTSGTGGGAATVTLPAQNLVVKGGLTIEANARLDHNGKNINIAGNLTIDAGGNLLYSAALPNITTLDGTDNATLSFLDRTGGTNDEQDFWSLFINKPANKVVSLASGKANLTGTNNNLINVQGDAFKLFSGTLDQGFHSVRLFCDTILNYQTVGVYSGATTALGTVANDANDMIRFRNNPTPTVLLTTPNAVFGAVRFNRAGAPMKLNSDLRIQLLEYLFGKWDIGTYRLTIDRIVGNNNNFSEPPPGDNANADSLGLTPPAAFGLYSVEDMIVTSGNSSDGGVAIRIFGNGTYRFPLGLGTSANDGANTPGTDRYTPALATISGFSDDGYIIINPVNGVLQTTNLAGGPNILSYYWRVRFQGFTTLPTVKYQFTYDVGSVGGSEATYVPGKVLDVNPFTRSSEAGTVNTAVGKKIIHFDGTGAGFTLEQANYTAGAATRFTGAPEIYYTKRGGDGFTIKWNNAANWTLATNGALGPHDSGQPNAPDYPQAGDIAIVGFVPFADAVVARRGQPHGICIDGITIDLAELRFTQMTNVSNNPTARVYAYNFQFRPTVVINFPNAGVQGQLTSAKVAGEGMFWIRSEGGNLSDPGFAGVDLGAFTLQDSAYVVYENTVNGANYVNLPSTFPNLMMATNGWGSANNSATISKNITVNGDLELLGNGNLVLSTGATGNITVNRNLRFFRSNANGNDSGGGGELRFGNTGTARTVSVLGNLLLGNGYDAIIRVLTPGVTPINHTFNLSGNFVQNTTAGNGFKAGTLSTQDRINVNLLGNTSMTLTNTAGDAPQFYSLLVNKGSSIATTATFNANFSIDGPSNAATKSLVLQNGLFIMNGSTSTVVLTSGGGNFSIPASAGLEVRTGTASATTTSTNANILLDGLLRVSGGDVLLDGSAGTTDTNFIEYSNSGSAAIEVTSGTLRVAGKIRRALTSVTGILRYTQSGGTVLIANESGSGSDDRGVFEVVNPGSQFNHSAGTFTIVQGINSTTVPSILIEPGTSAITVGSTITIGNGSTPAGANSQNIGIKATATLNNLVITGSNNPVVKIFTSPLTVANLVLVSSGTTLNANNQNLNIGGNFTVDGSYVPTSATTTFTNTAAAIISGTTPLLNFFNFSKTGAGLLTISKNSTINQDLSILAGTLATTSFAIDLKRHALVDGTITSTSGSGLIFSGSVQQLLTRTLAGTSTLGIVTVNNALGVAIPDATGYNFDISTGLRLQQGVFDIGGSLLFLRINAIITPLSPFSATNMIQTNSSFTDKGVRKEFPLNYTTDFTFPVGQLAYTPVIFNFSSPTNTTGATGTPTITVRPANERHPSVVNDDGAGGQIELPDPITFNDFNNVLQYHWILNADNVANTFKSGMTLSYPQSVVSVVAPYTESDYLSARILSDANPTKLINKFTTGDVDETTNVITFNFAGVTDAGISAEYFAGVDVGIPDKVPVYTTIASGNVNAAVYTPVVPGGGAPTGATVIVSTGHTLTFNVNSINLYETQINAGATVTIPSGSIGHRLGIVTGTGDLRIDSNSSSATLPAAVYDDFFSCTGGGLIFGGSGNYEILGGITSIRKLTLDGGGGKTLANNDVSLCNDFIINGGRFSNTFIRSITVQNDFLINSTIGVSIDGNLFITRDFTFASGAFFTGGNSGSKIIGRNLSVTGGNFISGAGANTIRINGNMAVAGAATFTGGASSSTGLKYIFQGAAPQTLTGDFAGTRFINRLEINNTNGLTLVGNADIQSELVLTAGNITPGNNTFTMNSVAVSTPPEGRSTSFVNGKLFKVFAAAGNSFVFPIGTGATLWRSGAVKNVSAAGTWDMEFIGTNADLNEVSVTNMTPIAPIVRISSGGYWVVTDGSVPPSGKTATIGLSWGIESDVNALQIERQDLRVVQWEPSPTSQWSNRGGTNFSAGNTQSRGTFDASLTTSFSRRIVTLGSVDVTNPLPVTFTRFVGRTDNGINVLQWSTASEKNNDYFEIERSVDNAETFEVIGRIEGKGTSQVLSSYRFDDREAKVGKNYYRLRQVDFDGTFAYHPDLVVLTLEFVEDLLDFDAFPNPTTDQVVNLKIFKNNSESVKIRFFDVNGKVCLIEENAFPEVQFKTESLSPGVYIIEVSQGFRRVTKRIVIKD